VPSVYPSPEQNPYGVTPDQSYYAPSGQFAGSSDLYYPPPPMYQGEAIQYQ
jgi:hypothetical protein